MAENSQKREENTVGKGEIARYKKRLVLQTRKHKGLLVNTGPRLFKLYPLVWSNFILLVKDDSRYEQFLLFPQCF